MRKKHRKELSKRIRAWEMEVLGYRVNRRKQLENIGLLLITVAFVGFVALYLEYMPVIVSALIYSF